MIWWQVGLVFVGIPAMLFCLIALIVMWLCEERTPDGIAAARRAHEDGSRDTTGELVNGSGAGAGRSRTGPDPAQPGQSRDE